MSDGSGVTTDQQSEPDGEQQLITIIVPTRNEAENISPLLKRVVKAVKDLRVEMLFVDDSEDNTAQHIESIQTEFPFPIRVIARPPAQRNGLSGAVVDGLRAADGEWVCVMDADLQHPPETIPLMWEKAEKSGADMVVGSRRGDLVGPYGLTKMRSLTSKVLTVLARMLFPRLLRNVSDPLTGLFLVKRSRIDIDVLRPDGFKILLEILVRCPDLHVTEIPFDFAPRLEGQSKADFREGVRFFRHVVRLRISVNPHLMRFLITLIIGFFGNSLLLWVLVERIGISYLLSGFLAAEALAIWIVILFDHWVFRERNLKRTARPSWKSFLLAQFILFFVYLPVMIGLIAWLEVDYLLANVLSLVIMGLLLYGFSEQWVWTRGGMVWQPQSYFYNVHHILAIESQVVLADLQHFAIDNPGKDIDIQIRLDRQGTPSHLPGGISYDERLGRFGFGMTVLPGEFLQIVVSPLLERSPSFLFTNIVEPVMRWSLVSKGYAMVKAASVTSGESAVLIHVERDLGQVMSILCRQYGYQFMADDLTIVDRGGTVYSYPKPVTVNQHMMRESKRSPGFRDRVFLWGQRLLYTRFARRAGLWLSDRNLPAATLNTYLQWLVPQPKDMLGEVYSGISYGEPAICSQIIGALEHKKVRDDDQVEAMINGLQQGEESAGFQPHPLLAKRLRYGHGVDLMLEERMIIKNLVETSLLRRFESEHGDWWEGLAKDIFENDPAVDRLSTLEKGSNRIAKEADSQGKLAAS
jgi:glycosyltransferase involved in cell wall biosynthesis